MLFRMGRNETFKKVYLSAGWQSLKSEYLESDATPAPKWLCELGDRFIFLITYHIAFPHLLHENNNMGSYGLSV